MKKQFLRFSILSFCVVYLFSCNPKTEEAKPVAGSVYVVCEGNFLSSNGSICIFNESTKQTQVDVFKDKNGVGLGDVVQSLNFIGDKAYIVVNNSNKIEIVDALSFESKASIKNLALPRNLAKVSDSKAYVTEYVSYGENGRISVIDLSTNTITKTISLGLLPEQLFVYGSKVLVSNNGENTISVINASTDAIEKTITVTGAPSGMVKDANGKLWILCSGIKKYNPDYSTDLVNSEAGALVRVNLENFEVEKTIAFSNKADSPDRLVINATGNKLYYLNNGVFEFDISSTNLNSVPFAARNFYGLGIEAKSGLIYTGTYGFSSNQKLIRYNTSGSALDSAEVGIGPRGFVFKN